jgi:hypothetical protein
MWNLSRFWEYRALGVFENWVLRVTFVPKGERVAGGVEDCMIMSFFICSPNKNLFG